jgi:hypothetical protein
MPIDGHLARTIATAGIVTHQPAFIVRRRLCADLALKLAEDGMDAERRLALRVTAKKTIRRADSSGIAQSFEDGRLVAASAAEAQPGGILEANTFRDLRFERCNLRVLLRMARSVDLVLPCIETKTFRKSNRVCARNRGTETFDGREDLLQEIVFNVRL